MSTNIQEIYYQNIRLLPEKEQLELASLILARLAQTPKSNEVPRTGDITRFAGMFRNLDADGSDMKKLTPL